MIIFHIEVSIRESPSRRADMMLKVAILSAVAFTLCKADIHELPNDSPKECEDVVDKYVVADFLTKKDPSNLEKLACVKTSNPVSSAKTDIVVCLHSGTIQNLRSARRKGECFDENSSRLRGLQSTVEFENNLVIHANASVSLNANKPLLFALSAHFPDVNCDVIIAFDHNRSLKAFLHIQNVVETNVNVEHLQRHIVPVVSRIIETIEKLFVRVLKMFFSVTLTDEMNEELDVMRTN